MISVLKSLLIIFLFIASKAISQTCPPNIGFESGTFTNWDCSSGTVQRDGSLNLSATGPIPGRHTIFANTYPPQVDPYGGFPVNCPNGSGYSVRLGNSSAGGEAEGMSYTINIPANQNDYSLIYNYAVVFENPPHQPWEQPRFTSKVFNVTDNVYISCGSFDFVASGNLPGFLSGGGDVFYKPWSPVTVNLTGYAGKTVRLEFTTNDCAFTRHFGYAYLDVNEDCSSSPILGNTYCAGATSLILTAPYGFASYRWFNADFSKVLGTNNILTITPPPPKNTVYAVEVIPYAGLGCQDTLFTKINVSNEPFNLNVIDSITGCSSGVDLTLPNITAGSSPGITYTYFTDANEINYVAFPKKVTTSGVYYIRGKNQSGCNDVKPIKVIIKPDPVFKVTDPEGVCLPKKIDITLSEITNGSEAGLTFTYWQDANATISLSNANALSNSGIYYIKTLSKYGCSLIKPVVVKIGTIPNLLIHNPTACGVVSLSAANVTAGSSPGLSYSYWTDNVATISLQTPAAITSSGNYFIKATSDSGCSVIEPVLATVNPYPVFTVTNPPTVVYPTLTVDITSSVIQNNNLVFTYWLDSLVRRPVAHPEAVDKRGTYFIKATNIYGCATIKSVYANIVPPPAPLVYAPNAFTANNDGLNDVFKIKIVGEVSINHLKIYNRWGQVVYDDPDITHHWKGKLKGVDLPVGVYIWILDGYDTYYKNSFTQKGIITLLR